MSLLESIGLAALRRIDPETAHGLAIRALKTGLVPLPGPVTSDRLRTTLAGLDLPTQARLARAFAALPQRLVTITHDPASLAQADRVIWLEDGRVRADGAAAEVTAAFMAEMARLGDQDADADLTP